MDIYDIATRSRVMRAVGAKNTKPELRVRRLLHSLGYRFRLHSENLPGKPDIVFPGRHKIILVHGCFWHQHKGCPHAARPSSNSDYWSKKLERNAARDREIKQKLESIGWAVLVVWECQTRNQDELLHKTFDFLGQPNSSVSIDLQGLPH